MWGACRGKLSQHYGQEVRYNLHNEEATIEHVARCELFTDLPNVLPYANLLKRKHFRDWKSEEQVEAIMAFTKMQMRVSSLTSSRTIEIRHRPSGALAG